LICGIKDGTKSYPDQREGQGKASKKVREQPRRARRARPAGHAS
jgi:hypothetical protein